MQWDDCNLPNQRVGSHFLLISHYSASELVLDFPLFSCPCFCFRNEPLKIVTSYLLVLLSNFDATTCLYTASSPKRPEDLRERRIWFSTSFLCSLQHALLPHNRKKWRHVTKAVYLGRRMETSVLQRSKKVEERLGWLTEGVFFPFRLILSLVSGSALGKFQFVLFERFSI